VTSATTSSGCDRIISPIRRKKRRDSPDLVAERIPVSTINADERDDKEDMVVSDEGVDIPEGKTEGEKYEGMMIGAGLSMTLADIFVRSRNICFRDGDAEEDRRVI